MSAPMVMLVTRGAWLVFTLALVLGPPGVTRLALMLAVLLLSHSTEMTRDVNNEFEMICMWESVVII